MCNYDKVEKSYICWKIFLGKFCYFHRTQGIIWFFETGINRGLKTGIESTAETGAENRD